LGRILGIDFGKKNVGVAVSDPQGLIAFPRGIIKVQSEQEWKEIQNIIQGEEIEEVVVGLPLRLDGSMGKSALEVQEFVDHLSGLIHIPVYTFDERFSSVACEKVLRGKKRIDDCAAAFMLQGYLDSQRNDD
jgi:putative Holliday junction resolvase